MPMTEQWRRSWRTCATDRTTLYGTSIDFTSEWRVLICAIGDQKSCERYSEKTADKCKKVCMKFSQLVQTSPGKAYSCLARGVQEKLFFTNRTTPRVVEMLGKTDANLTKNTIPAPRPTNKIRRGSEVVRSN